jgi:hypothetical protein
VSGLNINITGWLLNNMICKKLLHILVSVLLPLASVNLVQAQKFEAIGPRNPVQLSQGLAGSVEVTFDLLPTTMSFDLPWHYCMVAENGIKFANLAPRTYGILAGKDSLFAPGMDKEGRYVRVWIEQASAARIVVRIRYALCNADYKIAHADIHSNSPYGDGDWGDEWYYIYPDGTYVRHIKLYTGLASMSLPFGFDREPPQVVHEFMVSVVIGTQGHVPSDDINTDCLRLIKLVGNHTGDIYRNGKDTTVSYNPCPQDYGDFSRANIMLINSRSAYKPFTIGLPYGSVVLPYVPENGNTYPFETWTGYEETDIAYVSAIGYMLNYWHFRRTQTTLEQIYLHGMTNVTDPQADLVHLAWSWISAPRLLMSGLKYDYLKFVYDQTQRAYILPRESRGPETLEFMLDEYENMNAPMRLVNPAFVVRNWDDTTHGIVLKVNNNVMEAGKDYRFGYEQTEDGQDLVIWLQLNTRSEINISVEPSFNTIEEQIRSDFVSISPSPASDKIDIALFKTINHVNIEICDLAGKICFANSYRSENIAIDISDLAAGIYIVIVKSKDGTVLAAEKVMKG